MSDCTKTQEHTKEEIIAKLEKERDFYKRELDKFNQMIDWTPCTISWITKDLTYVGVNKALCDLCEREKSEFIGQKVGNHTNQEFLKEFSKKLFDSKQVTETTNLTSEIDGEIKKFYLIGRKFNNEEEAVIIGVDITELLRLQQTIGLMERLSSLGEMVAGIVHEINNPLTMISLKGAMIKKYLEKGDSEKAVEAGTKIQETCHKMGKIIEGVKTFVRQGSEDPHSEGLLHETIKESALLIESKLKDSGIEVEFPDGPDIKFLGNQTQLFQVFVDLMTNSIDAIRENETKWIKISTEIFDEDRVRILFVDSGTGIPEKIEKNIFESFFTTKGKGKGTGLGLSLCRKIVQSHGGQLYIDSEKPHTTFCIEIPLHCKAPIENPS